MREDGKHSEVVSPGPVANQGIFASLIAFKEINPEQKAFHWTTRSREKG
jgi:hypothetical protein